MARNWIVVGDATTGGGWVITGSAYTDIDGIAVARVTDKATCPAHKGVFPIINGDSSINIDGQPVAVHGSALACGCKLLAVKQSHVFVDAGGSAGAAGATPVAKVVGAIAKAAHAAATLKKYDQAIRFVTLSGEAMANVRYTLHMADGATACGKTNDEGITERIATDKSERIVKAEIQIPTDSSMCCASSATDGADEELETIDVEGVATTDAELGSSVVKVEAPGHERALTSGEIEMAKLVFGSSVDYAKVKVHNHGYWMFLGLQQKETAVTPNGEMYFPKDIYREDFSLAGLDFEALFVHEMVHVWQHQLGYPVRRIRAPRPKMSYDYYLDGTKKLCDYNMEAQGAIISDYFLTVFRNEQEGLSALHYRYAFGLAGRFQLTLSDFLVNPASTANLSLTTKDDQE